MSLIVNREIQENQWSHLSDQDSLQQGDVTVSLARWQEQRAQLQAHHGGIGVRLKPEDEVEALVSCLDDIQMIALVFDQFTEGRGYSQARLLRDKYGYTGELRALGARRDHLAFMERCGIDSFELASQEDADQALSAFGEVEERYQPSTDNVPLVFHRRNKTRDQVVL